MQLQPTVAASPQSAPPPPGGNLRLREPRAARSPLSTMRARLIAAFAVVALLGVGLVGGYGLYQEQGALHERVDSAYAARNQVVAREMEIRLKVIWDTLNLLQGQVR